MNTQNLAAIQSVLPRMNDAEIVTLIGWLLEGHESVMMSDSLSDDLLPVIRAYQANYRTLSWHAEPVDDRDQRATYAEGRAHESWKMAEGR